MNRQFIYWFLPVLLLSCSKKLAITDIDNIDQEIANYEDDIRIEAILYPTENSALIRIDRTYSLDETQIYNCIDDDGDWFPFNDQNNNGIRDDGEELIDDLGTDGQLNDPEDEDNDGIFDEASAGENNGIPDCGEPNIDELDEILGQTHIDSTICSSVRIIDPFGQVFDSYYNSSAGTLISYPEYTWGQDETITEQYGAWQADIEFDLELLESLDRTQRIYSLECDCGIFGVISAEDTIPLPVEFYEDSSGTIPLFENIQHYPTILDLIQGCNVDNFWLTSSTGELISSQNFFYKTHSLYERSFWINVEEFSPSNIDITNCEPSHLNYIHSFPTFSTENSITEDSSYIIGTPIADIPGYYQIDVQAMSSGFEHYFFYTGLGLKDPVRSNLRDESGNVRMGYFGSLSTNTLYTIVQLPPMFYFSEFNPEYSTLDLWIDSEINFSSFVLTVTGGTLNNNLSGGELAENSNWNYFIDVNSGQISANSSSSSIQSGENILIARLNIEPDSLSQDSNICIENIGISNWEGHDIPYIVFYGPCITIN